MDPFRNYRQAFPALARHCPFGGCEVCCSQPALMRREFSDLVNRSWSLHWRNLTGSSRMKGSSSGTFEHDSTSP
jgi:hypothetical protein